MRKRFFVLFSLFFYTILVSAQNIGIGTSVPASSALLDVSSNNKGVLIPRLTNTEMISNVASPVEGLMVYNITLKKLFFYNGSQWQAVSAIADSAWTLKGNTGTNSATHFFGTTDNKDLVFKRNNLQSGLINVDLGNTSWGAEALHPATTGNSNVANGYQALHINSSGSGNTAIGFQPLVYNTAGNNNTANGFQALFFNTTGNNNTAHGVQALGSNTTGSYNTGVGYGAGANNSGSSNIFIGNEAGANETGSNKLYISKDNGDENNALIYGEFDNKLLRTNGRTEVNSNSTATAGSKVIKNFAVGTNSNISAIYGENAVDDNYGIGVEGKGGRVGVQGTATGTGVIAGYIGVKGVSDGSNSAFNFGVQGQASGSLITNAAVKGEALGSTGNKYGLHGSATGAGGTNYGVYGAASGGSANYAGYFNGNVFTDAKLGIGITSPNFPLDVKGAGINNDLIKFYDNTNAAKWHLNLAAGNLVFVETNVADNQMVFKGGGWIGVGRVPSTNAADSRLQVKPLTGQSALGIESSSTTNHWDFFVDPLSGTSLQINYNGNPRGTFNSATGAYTTLSDRRLKKDISHHGDVMNSLKNLNVYRYHYIDNASSDKLSNGFMAQDVQKLFPDAVSEVLLADGEKRLGINYQYFTVLAVKGLQEQQKIIESQERRLKKLEAQVQLLLERK